jgi:predicted molibdopterin-dependent oxidoreductase YjgC
MEILRREMVAHQKTSTCPICGAACRMSFDVAESGEVLRIRPVSISAAGSESLCTRGRFLLKKWLQRPDRLHKPLVLQDGQYHETDWATVLDVMANKLGNCGPWETAALVDSRLTTEELFLLQKFARTVLRTNLVGCITPSGHAAAAEFLSGNHRRAILRGGLKELSRAGCVLAIGVNPPAANPVAATHLEKAVLNGTKLIVANPLSLDVCRHADVNLHYSPGTEPVLIAGLIRLLLDKNHEDPAFLARHPFVLHTMKGHLATYQLENVARITGVHPENLMKAACLMGVGGVGPLTILFGAGLVESCDVRECMKAMAMLLHLTGSVSKAGGGLIPLYGNGNLHGASELGMISQLFETPKGVTGCTSSVSGNNICEMLNSGQIRALYLAFDNLESRSLDFLKPFLHKLDLVVLHDTVFSPLTWHQGGPLAQVVLPMASVLEKGGTYSDIDREAVDILAVIAAPGEARSVLWVLQELARRMKAPGLARENEEALRDEIRRQIAASTTLGRKPRKTSSCSSCCRTPANMRLDSDFRDTIPDWSPPPVEVVADQEEREFPFKAVAKEDLAPYVLGPLLDEVENSVFFPGGEIELNPLEASRIGLVQGDVVCVVRLRAGAKGVSE